ncbi:uncharacterized protein LOC119668042 [Teleopsis dalmanni]|uniref:uncharacterized protein LOC119668042 n=1 Tax=Teleopsis dalmanni TaxID=139649 RepID=UPI0018CEC085|nr:uncharacterized protein LOC119668042 [Teleopsis dalmanni]
MSIRYANPCPKFDVFLDGRVAVENELQAFTRACHVYNKENRRRGYIKRRKTKRRYYKLGLVAEIETETTNDQIDSLLMVGVRTFYFDAFRNRPENVQQMIQRTKIQIEQYRLGETASLLVTSLAITINGENCVTGRMRNNCTDHLKRGEIVSLTSDERYKYCSYREIAYVSNLSFYLSRLSLNDEIQIGPSLKGPIVKKLTETIAILVEVAGPLHSYMDVELPSIAYTLSADEIPHMFAEDLGIAINANVNYIVVPKLRNKKYLMILRSYIPEEYALNIIGVLDFEYIRDNMCDIRGILKQLDYLWIPDMFSISHTMQRFVFDEVIPIAKSIRKPIIGTIHMERRIDFNNFENHYFLWKIDTIFIERSITCKKYPLIVKKLLPLYDYRKITVDKCSIVKEILTAYDTVVNFIIRTICSVECQAIFVHATCEPAALALGRVEIYCPVFVVMQVDEADPFDVSRKHSLARAIQLRRNLQPLLYTEEMNKCDFTAVEYGIDYARNKDLLHTGDFIITIEVAKLPEEEEEEEIGEGEDGVILRATFLPPIKKYEQFKFS